MTERAEPANGRKPSAAAAASTKSPGEPILEASSPSLQAALAAIRQQMQHMSETLARLEGRLAGLTTRTTEPQRVRSDHAAASRRSETQDVGDEDSCLVPGCKAGVLAKQLCETHYRIMRRTTAGGETFDPIEQRPARARIASRACDEEGCSDPHYAKGLCRRHYMATRSRIRAAERGSAAPETPPAAQMPRPFRASDDDISPHAPSTSPSNVVRALSFSTPGFGDRAASTASSREALPTAEVVSRVVTQYRGGLDRVAEVLGRNKRTLMELLDRLDLMPFVTRVREAERQRVESSTLRERLDDLLFREKLLDDLGCLKDVDERARFEVKMRCADLAKSSETIEEALQRLARDLDLDDAGMKRLIWRYDLRRYLRGLKLKPEAAPARTR